MVTKNKIALGVLAALALADRSVAADYDLSFHVGDTYTDNAFLTPSNEQSDHIGAAAMRLDLAAGNDRYDATLRTAMTYMHYFKDTFEDELLRGLEGVVNINIVPGKVFWRIQENYGPVLDDPLAADRPDNWTYDSYFTTGPEMQFGELEEFHVVASASYSRADYENDTTPDNEQYEGRLTFALPGTERYENSLNLMARRIEQRPVPELGILAEGFDMQEGFIRIRNELKRWSFEVDAGATALQDAGESQVTPLFRAQLERTLTAHLTMSLQAGSQFSENLARFSRLQTDSPDVDNPRDDVTPLGDPMEERFANLMFEFDGRRTFAALVLGYNELDYEGSSSDFDAQEYSDATFDLRRQISPRFSLNLGGSFNRREYQSINRRDDDSYAFVAFGWRASRDLELTLVARNEQRDSTDPTADYDENSLLLEVSYQFAERKVPAKSRNRFGRFR
jgi:hypothetical protein